MTPSTTKKPGTGHLRAINFRLKIFVLSILAGSFILPGFSFAATLFDYINSGDNDYGNFSSMSWLGQTFKASDSYTITSIKFKMLRTDLPGTMTASIRGTSGGLPTGGDLCSGTTNADLFTTSTSGAWYDVSFSSCSILKNTTYAIIIRSQDSGNPGWRRNLNDDIYASGKMIASANSGSSWGDAASGNADAMFEIYGNLPGETGHIIDMPANALASTTGVIGDLINNLFIFIELAIGVPLAFYFTKKWLNLFKF